MNVDDRAKKSDLIPTKEYLKIQSDNAICIDFDKIFKDKDLKDLNVFVLKKKKVYANIKSLVIGYVNYFIEHYDHDNELLYSYLQLKFMIDENKRYKKKKVFITDVYEYLLSDTMVEKIKNMTEDLYNIDLESSTKKKKDSYNETLQFDNNHGKIMMEISIAIKIFIPVISHFMYKMQIKRVDEFIFKCFKNIYKYFQGKYKINNKLYEMILSRVLKTRKKDKLMWQQGEIRGEDFENKTEKNFHKLHVDIMAKLTFDGNVIHYCIRSMDNSISHQMREKYIVKFSPITNDCDSDGFSGFEKLEMHTSRFDESSLIQNKINVKQTIKKLKNKFDIDFYDDEIEYYMENLHVLKFQRELIFQYFAKYFGSTSELCACNKRNYCKLIIIMKEMLERRNYQFIQHILTGNLIEKVELKKSQKKKQMIRIINSSRYVDLMNYEYKDIGNIFSTKKNMIEEYKDYILNYKFALVDYKNIELTGKIINNKKYKDLIADELLRFIGEI